MSESGTDPAKPTGRGRMQILRCARHAIAVASLLLGCDTAEVGTPSPSETRTGPASVALDLAGERFHVELAADDLARFRGLSGRRHITRNSGMLFAYRRPEPRTFVMRDCLVPIDIAFLDSEGRVLAIHSMEVEPSRRPGESLFEYANRLRPYTSGAPSQFVVETAGGRLVEVGLRVGDRVVFDREAVLRRLE